MTKLKQHFLLHRRLWSAILAAGLVAAMAAIVAFFIWLAKVNAAILVAIPLLFVGGFLVYVLYIIGSMIYDDIRLEIKWGRWKD